VLYDKSIVAIAEARRSSRTSLPRQGPRCPGAGDGGRGVVAEAVASPASKRVSMIQKPLWPRDSRSDADADLFEKRGPSVLFRPEERLSCLHGIERIETTASPESPSLPSRGESALATYASETRFSFCSPHHCEPTPSQRRWSVLQQIDRHLSSSRVNWICQLAFSSPGVGAYQYRGNFMAPAWYNGILVCVQRHHECPSRCSSEGT